MDDLEALQLFLDAHIYAPETYQLPSGISLQDIERWKDLVAKVRAQYERAERLEKALRVHKHTDECLRYAAEHKMLYCIAHCANSRREALAELKEP